MFVRSLKEVEPTERFVNWGNGTSHRLLTAADKMGFTVCHTVVRAGTESLLEYRNHLEACYCIGGEGEVEDMDGALTMLEQQGVKAAWGPVKRPDYARAEIRDPDSNPIELRQWYRR